MTDLEDWKESFRNYRTIGLGRFAAFRRAWYYEIEHGNQSTKVEKFIDSYYHYRSSVGLSRPEALRRAFYYETKHKEPFS